MSLNASELIGLMIVCVPMLLFIIYSVRYSKKNPGSREEPPYERSAPMKVSKAKR
ncbi:hypothetical protein [Desulfoferrobacter suflitae]|uniref:hypothetical protein n=1 Tax=Desulfoferrobacter suflitae TaxID=2865782 RepID=UPI002164585F|nr:hypothetical protein [Desulfoferrobacter suflitae]MCK8603645.1 hypothetical protein [Desulfoferrobacter suflitae]